MRIDIKKVKGKHYLQYVDKSGYLHHLGSANDFDSWLLSLLIWNKEYLDGRKELFESIKTKARQYIELDEEKEKVFDNLYDRYVPWRREAKKKRIYVPKSILGVWTEADESLLLREARLVEQHARVRATEEWKAQFQALWESKQKHARASEKIVEEWSARLQKRLDNLYTKQRRIERKKKQTKQKS